MLEPIFWLISIGTVALFLYQIILKGNLFGVGTYILVGVYIPLFLSFFNWSPYHVANRGDNFYFIFIIWGVICSVVSIMPQGGMSITNIQFAYKNKKFPIEVINVAFVGFVLLENYYISGYVFPSLRGIDIHTMRMPFVYFLTTGVYIVAVMDLIEFLITKKKRYLVYLVLAVLLNVISKSARVDAFICVVQVISFCAFYFFSKRNLVRKGEKIIKKKKNSRFLFVVLVVLLLVGVVFYSLETGNDRMNHYGKYEYTYAGGIKYSGPEFLGDILPYYYGYFGLSFDNLAYNLNNVPAEFQLWGPNTFRALWFGILQFDNLLGLNGSAAPRANQIRCAAAAVSTAFWDMYYDYEYLIFIPFIISFVLYFILRKRVTGRKVKAMDIVLYFFWVPLWFFMSFDNRMYDYQIIWQVLIMHLLIGHRYELLYDEKPIKYENVNLVQQKSRKRHLRIRWR